MGTKYDTIVNIQITYKTLWQNLTTIQQLCNNLIQIKDEFPNINVWLDLSLQDRSSHGLQIFLSLWILFCRMGRLIGIFHDDVASPALCWRPCHKSFSGIAHHPSQLCGNPWYAYSRHSFAQMLVHKLHTWTSKENLCPQNVARLLPKKYNPILEGILSAQEFSSWPSPIFGSWTKRVPYTSFSTNAPPILNGTCLCHLITKYADG